MNASVKQHNGRAFVARRHFALRAAEVDGVIDVFKRSCVAAGFQSISTQRVCHSDEL